MLLLQVQATLFFALNWNAQLILGQTETADSLWLQESRSFNDANARASRYDWTGVLDNPQCPGNVLSLNPGEATRIYSHKGYGKETYPENYRVSDRTKRLILELSIGYCTVDFFHNFCFAS